VLPLPRQCSHGLKVFWCGGGYFEAAIEQAQQQGVKSGVKVDQFTGAEGLCCLPKRRVVERTFA
jgi:hypothetical protein